MKTYLLLGLLALVAMGTAGAQSVSAPTFGAGASVIGGGTCAVTTTPAGILATSMELTAASSWIVDTLGLTINQGLANIRAGQLQETTALSKTIDGLAASINQSLIQQTQTQIWLKGMELHAPGAHLLNGCAAAGIGTTGFNAISATSQVKQALVTSQHRYGYMFGNPGQETAYLATRIGPQDTTAAALFPDNGTINANNEVNTLNYGLLITNPKPVPMPPQNATTQNNPMAQQSLADANVYNAQIQLAQDAINHISALHTASLPVTPWMQSDWNSMGGTGVVAGSVNNQISPDAALALQVRSRYANSAWIKQVNLETSLTLSRESVLMQAIELQENYERMQLEERILAILAAQYASQVNTKMRPVLIRDYQAYRQSGVQ